jgi:hypothetical protein
MKTTLTFLAFLFTVCAAADAQVAPAATAGGANLSYVVRYSQTAEFGSSLGDWQTSNASAEVDYANGKGRLPFSLNYGGGYTWTLAGPTYMTGLFQRLLLSQGIDWRRWKITVSDDVSYTPQAPTTGFSGIPGIGEPIGGAGPNPPSDQSILTLKTHVVNNDANGNVEHDLNYATTLSAGASSVLLRYPDGNGLNINQLMANTELTRRLNARNSLTGTYMFSQFSYPDYGFSFQANSLLFGFKRSWNPKITSDISAGPEWKGSSNSAVVPSSTTVAANAAVRYKYRFVTASLTYIRAANNGGGYLFGAESDSVGANYTREFGRKLTIGLTGDYMRTSGLINNGVTNSKYGGAQATRLLGRHFTVFASYTAIDQSSSSQLPTNAITSLMQVIGFGISYSPRKTHISE